MRRCWGCDEAERQRKPCPGCGHDFRAKVEKRGRRLGRGWWYSYRDGEGIGIECGPYLTKLGARFSRWVWGRA